MSVLLAFAWLISVGESGCREVVLNGDEPLLGAGMAPVARPLVGVVISAVKGPC
jgi:hypothetical protein